MIAAVHGYCLGGGVGIAGNADIVVAADDSQLGLPEVDRGALGVGDAPRAPRARSKRCARCSSPGPTVGAEELLAFGTVERVVPRAELLDCGTRDRPA